MDLGCSLPNWTSYWGTLKQTPDSTYNRWENGVQVY